MKTTRRDLLKTAGLGAATMALAQGAGPSLGEEAGASLLSIDPEPRFDLSPYLYMQFMEPLGTTDSSVEAAWDHGRDCWREDVVEVTKELAPPLLRWGGAFSSYYRWKEAVGPRDRRVPMQNLVWGGMETNQVGTVEFLDFCRQVGAEPLMSVNFESDGCKAWMATPKGKVQTAGPDEAAEWVDYCNNPKSAARIAHGLKEPCPIRLWQIGNETSYHGDGFGVEVAAAKTLAFAKAMRKVDPTIALIGWGDSGWANRMIELTSGQLQYVAFHHMYTPGGDESPLAGNEYRKDPARTWQCLMEAWKPHEARIRAMRDLTAGTGVPLALTECHFAVPGPHRNAVLTTWAAGVSMARLLNVHTRHGDVLKIATAADFCGTRWQVNALMIPVPGGRSHLMPVGLVMALYRKHSGEKACTVAKAPDGLDVTASRTGDRVFLHVVNTQRTRAVGARIGVAQQAVQEGKVFALAADPEAEVMETDPDVVRLSEGALPADGAWEFPAASVSAVELTVRQG